jgi:hypothetical protein
MKKLTEAQERLLMMYHDGELKGILSFFARWRAERMLLNSFCALDFVENLKKCRLREISQLGETITGSSKQKSLNLWTRIEAELDLSACFDNASKQQLSGIKTVSVSGAVLQTLNPFKRLNSIRLVWGTAGLSLGVFLFVYGLFPKYITPNQLADARPEQLVALNGAIVNKQNYQPSNEIIATKIEQNLESTPMEPVLTLASKGVLSNRELDYRTIRSNGTIPIRSAREFSPMEVDWMHSVGRVSVVHEAHQAPIIWVARRSMQETTRPNYARTEWARSDLNQSLGGNKRRGTVNYRNPEFQGSGVGRVSLVGSNQQLR